MKLSTKQWGIIGFIGTSLVLGVLFLATTSLLITQDMYRQIESAGPSTTGTPFIRQVGVTPTIRQGGLIVTPSSGGPKLTPATPTATPAPFQPPGEQISLPDPNQMFDINFRPDPNGFRFRNYGSRYPEGDLSIAEVQDLFGPAVCSSGSGQSCLPIPAAQLWIDTMNDYMTDGHCAGFTLASRRFYEDQLDHSLFHTSASVTFDIDQNVPSMRQIAKDWVMQVTEEVWQARVGGSPREVVDALLNLGQPVDLGIFGRTGGGHSLLAYGIEDKGDGHYHIRVYDNNWPGRDLFVEVDYPANTWRYSLGANNPQDDIEAWEGDDTTKTFMFIPFPIYDQPVTCPFCENGSTGTGSGGTTAAQFNFIALKGDEGLLQVTDSSGNRIGHYGDDFVSEVVDARLIRLKDNMYNDREPYLALPVDLPFTVQVLPRPGKQLANTFLRAGGPGFVFAVDGLDLASGQVGQISVVPGDQQVIFNSNGLSNPTMKMALEQNGSSTFAVVGDTTLDSGENLNMFIDPQSGELVISNLPLADDSGEAGTTTDAFINISREANTVSVVVVVIEPNQSPLIFANPAIPLPPGGSAALDVANWDGTAPMTIHLDRNGDGPYEETWAVENVPVADLIEQFPSAQTIIAGLGELGPYLNKFQVEALLDALADAGGQCTSARTLTTHKLDGDDIGEVLYAFEMLSLTKSELADFIDRLNYRPDEVAHLLFDLHLSPAEQLDLLNELDMLPAEADLARSELAALNTVDKAIDEWEWQNQPLSQLPGFLQQQNLSAAQIGFFLDELNLEQVELADILAALNLTDDQLAVIFYELNVTETQWNEMLAGLGREPRLLTSFATGSRETSVTTVSSWETAASVASLCTFQAQAPTPTPTHTPVPSADDDDDGGGGGGPGNSLPVINPDNPTVNEDTPTDIFPLANDFDPDGDPLTIIGATAGSSGGVVINTNSGGQIAISASGTKITYSPNFNFVGNDSFNYTASDGKGGSGTAAVNVTVINANNDAPYFTSSPITMASRNVLYTYSITTADPDPGDILTVSAPTLPAWLTLTPTGNGTADLTGTPGNAQVGDHNVVLQVQDAGGLTATQQFTITVQYSLIVDTTSDADLQTCTSNPNDCSLRGAINVANAIAGTDTINFNIPGAGPHTINVGSVLPTVTDPAIIDGSTQPGSSCAAWPPTLLIELNGTSTAGIDDNGLSITAGNSTIRGLIINRFADDGIDLQTNGNNTIQCNFIGTNTTGTGALGNSTRGIVIRNSSSNNIIGGTTAGTGNLLSGNGLFGIQIYSAGNIVQGNYIGTDVNGTAALPNTNSGVRIDAGASNNTIGGTTAGVRNLISSNGGYGIEIQGPANGNFVQGNYIGTDINGTADLGNTNDGIRIANSPNNTIGGTTAAARNLISGNDSNGIQMSGATATGNLVQGNYIGTDVAGTADLGNTRSGIRMASAPNNIIGGTVAGAGNLLSGNDTWGLSVDGATATTNTVQGNYIGTNVNGTAALGNGWGGVSIQSDTDNNIIGGTTGTTPGGPCTGACNLISGNSGTGIFIDDPGTTGNKVQGNYIGTQVDGTTALGNTSTGVRIDPGAANNIIGGTGSGEGNRIAYNNFRGIYMNGVATINNAIRGNNIFTNTGIGIELLPAGVTPNDATDADTGPNNLQNFPVITATLSGGANITISGSLTSTAGTLFELDFFSNSVCDGSGNGEGETYIGSSNVTTGGGGVGPFSVTFPVAVPSGRFITATATDPGGNTSEFSACRVVP